MPGHLERSSHYKENGIYHGAIENVIIFDGGQNQIQEYRKCGLLELLEFRNNTNINTRNMFDILDFSVHFEIPALH